MLLQKFVKVTSNDFYLGNFKTISIKFLHEILSRPVGMKLKASRGGNLKINLLFIYILLSLSNISATHPIEIEGNPLSIEKNEKKITGFTFDCIAPLITGSFYSSGVAQSGFITLRISNVTSGATRIVVISANGFSGGITSTTLVATQTTIQIPISFTGTSAVGTYTLNISSPNATNNCNVSVPVSACSSYKPSIATNVPTTLCIGDSITMTASSGTRYAWSTGETTASILKKAAGNYTVTVTSNGCTGSNSQTVSYNSNCETGFCSGVLSANSYNITFGKGSRTDLASAVSGATTTHVYSPFGPIIDGQYAVSNNATDAGGWAANTADHSGDGTTGRLMVINADNTPKECFRLPVSGLCSNLKYQFSAWIRSISNKPEKPNVTLEIRDAVTDSLLAIKGTSDIPFGTWIQYGITFNTPNNPNLKVVLRNNTKGGTNGNDIVIDDIQFAYCGPPTILTMQGGTFDAFTGEGSACKGKLMTLKAVVTSGYINVPVYQWQESLDNGTTWRDISGATTLNHSFTADTTFSGRKFKLLVAESGKITNPSCRVESNVLTFRFQTSLGIINVTGSTTFCTGDSAVLTATNGSLYAWNTGENTASVTKKTAGAYTVTITDAGGCVSNASKTLVVNANPTASITTVGESNVNSGGTATLTASGGSIYSWSTGDNTTSISVNRAGTYTVTVTSSDCRAITSKTIGPNNAPQVTNSTPNVTGNTAFSGSVAFNASDIDGNLNPNSFTVTDNPLRGTISMNPNGTYIYTPNPNFSGIDSVHYRVCDLGGLCTTGTLIFTVTIAPNQPPIVTNATPTVQEDVPLTGSVVSNASDTDNNLNPNGFSVTNSPQNGTITMNPNGTYVYTPKPNFNGIDSVQYKVCDLKGACTTASIIFTVKPVNDAPVLTNSTPSVQEDIPLSGNVAPNASDVDGNLNPSSFTVTDSTKNGTIAMNPNGTYIYTPKPNFNGIDSVHYKVCDSTNTCVTATIIFTVSPVNDAPTVTSATATVLEDVLLNGSVLSTATDVDANLNPNSFTVTDSPLHGTITMSPNGAYTYTPNPNFNGLDSVHYRVCDLSGACSSATLILTVTPVNDVPTLLNATPALDEDLPFTSSVLPNANDIDGNLNPNSFVVLNSPLHGIIIMNPNGTYTYTPALDFVGQDSVRYRVCDMSGVCATASIVFSISSVNDAPTLVNATPSVKEDEVLIRSVSSNANDVDNNLNPNSFTVLDSPLNGTIIMSPNGNYVYTPRADFNGVDSVHYQVCDFSGACVRATMIISVIPANDAPKVNITAPLVMEDTPVNFCGIINDKDLKDTFNTRLCTLPKGSLNFSINNNLLCIDFKPNKDVTGQDTICVLVCDKGGLCDTVKIPINVIAVNDPPSLVVNTIVVPADSTTTQCFLIADPDAFDAHSAFFCETPKGKAQMKVENGNVCLTYSTKFPNFENDAICVILCDKAGACTQAYIPIIVTPCEDKMPPVINCPNNIEVSTAGTVINDPSGFILQSSIADDCNGVNLSFKTPSAIDDCHLPIIQQIGGSSSGGIFSKGLNVLTFEALDNSGKKTTCRAEIMVSTTQLLAVDNISACLNETLNIQASLINNALYTWKGPQNLISNSSSLNIPLNTTTQSGQYILSVNVGKNCVFKDTVTVNISSAPKVLNDTFTVEMDGTLIDNVLKNDIVTNGIVYTLRTRDNAVNGNLSLKSDGSITYKPTTGYTGVDNFTYEVCTDICPNTCQKGTVVVKVEESAKKIYKANEVITPNGDNFNEALIIEDFNANDPKNKSSIVIYSQWGELVFTASPYLNNWKGTHKDLPLPSGTYYYIFKATPDSEPLKSFITVFR